MPVDAIPDIGENQQIVFTEWHGRSPQDVDDQITYPLTSTLLGIAGVKTVRSQSMFGFSSIYVIFEEFSWFERNITGKDIYWTRSRILEKLNSLPSGILPDGVQPILGPDATALGQVFWYTLEGRDKNGIEINKVEYVIRGLGFIKGLSDIEKTVIKVSDNVLVYIKNVANVSFGPALRRGVLDKGGAEAAGGVVVVRYGYNSLQAIKNVKEKIKELTPGLPQKTLPDGMVSQVKIVPFYDRTGLIYETLGTLETALTEEILLSSAGWLVVRIASHVP